MKRSPIIKILIIITLAAVFLFTAGMAAPSEAQAKAKLDSKDFIRKDYIHYIKNAVKTPAQPETGYKLMGVKWNAFPVTYSLNYASAQAAGLDPVSTASKLSQSSEEWDTYYGPELFNDTVGNTSAKYGLLDGTNAVEFKAYKKKSVIAITSVWFTRTTMAIAEFDMLFNTYYTWGDADINKTVMDIRNIATHELGHSVGLADIYSDTYNYVTMYGYATYGETLKRSLDQKDIDGLHTLYGN